MSDARGGTKKKVFLANIYERIWPKKISGDTEHEGETLSTGEGVVYMPRNVFVRCSGHTDLYSRHLSVLVAVDKYSRHAYLTTLKLKKQMNLTVGPFFRPMAVVRAQAWVSRVKI